MGSDSVGLGAGGETSVLLMEDVDTRLLNADGEEVREVVVDVVEGLARRTMNPGLESSGLFIANEEAAALNRKTYLALMSRLVSGIVIVHAKFPAVVKFRFAKSCS